MQVSEVYTNASLRRITYFILVLVFLLVCEIASYLELKEQLQTLHCNQTV